MPQANWMLLEWELEQLARLYGWRMDQSVEGDKLAIAGRASTINITQLAHDLIERGVTVKKHAVSTQT